MRGCSLITLAARVASTMTPDVGSTYDLDRTSVKCGGADRRHAEVADRRTIPRSAGDGA